MAKAKPKSKWKTLRCVVEYRTPSDWGERELAAYVQGRLDSSESYHTLDSKMWAKGFNRTLSTMHAARPKKMQAALKALDAAVARLRKL